MVKYRCMATWSPRNVHRYQKAAVQHRETDHVPFTKVPAPERRKLVSASGLCRSSCTTSRPVRCRCSETMITSVRMAPAIRITVCTTSVQITALMPPRTV